MPLRGDEPDAVKAPGLGGVRGRVLFERSCRLVALACLAVAVVLSVRDATPDALAARRVPIVVTDTQLADTAGTGLAVLREAVLRDAILRDAIVHGATVPDGARRGGPASAAVDTLAMTMPQVPSWSWRAALGSMVASGVPFSWRDSTSARGLAVSVSRSASPAAPIVVRVATGNSSSLTLRDAGGVLDSVPRAETTMAWRLGNANGVLRAVQGRSVAIETPPDSVPARRVLLFALPGWEGKFTAAALEEAGWQVDGTLQVSPTGRVTIGDPQRLDTARYAAVVVADSMSVDAGALTQFVTRGGGLVLAGDALRIPSLALLRPARAGSVRGAIAGALLTSTPRRGLEAWELTLADDAVVLASDAGEHDHDEPAMVAKRVGTGRVVAMPYRELWRWRMQGTDDGMTEHRRWWQSALAAALPDLSAGDDAEGATRDALPGPAAPYADLVARAGMPDTSSARPADSRGGIAGDDVGTTPRDIPWWPGPRALLLTATAALLGEWASRRLRGAR